MPPRHVKQNYTFGSQRLWTRHPGIDNSGITGFFQFGINDSDTMPVNKYFGVGLAGLGLVPGRPKDSMGAGVAVSWLNENLGKGHCWTCSPAIALSAR